MSKAKKEAPIEDEFSLKSKDTPLEKIAHGLISWVGSWTFLALNFLWFVLWILLGLHYDWLTFWVSLEAIVLSILILINENREIRSDRERAIKDYKIDLGTARRLKDIEKQLQEIRSLLGKTSS